MRKMKHCELSINLYWLWFYAPTFTYSSFLSGKHPSTDTLTNSLATVCVHCAAAAFFGTRLCFINETMSSCSAQMGI